jgi:hypothetical protein
VRAGRIREPEERGELVELPEREFLGMRTAKAHEITAVQKDRPGVPARGASTLKRHIHQPIVKASKAIARRARVTASRGKISA